MRVRSTVSLINPTDVLTKHKPRQQTARHFAFLMGYPELALQLWRQSVQYKTHKYKRIVPVSRQLLTRDFASAQRHPPLSCWTMLVPQTQPFTEPLLLAHEVQQPQL